MRPFSLSLYRLARILEDEGGSGRVRVVGPDGAEAGGWREGGAGFGAVTPSGITYDSRAAAPGCLFVCKGASFRPQYLKDAVAAGAACYLSAQAYPWAGVPGVVVSDVRHAMGVAACELFGRPSERLDLVAITGTKGKTTVSLYVDASLRARGPRPDGSARRSGLVGGLWIDDGAERVASHNTTPESVELQRHLARAVQAGCDTVVMEASSQGFKYDRTLGCRFAVGAFTNIGEDHISQVEHPTFEDYLASKLKIFSQSRLAVVNVRCDHLGRVLGQARAHAGGVLLYDPALPREGRLPERVTLDGEELVPDVFPERADRSGEGSWDLRVSTPTGPVDIDYRGIGAFNVGNAVAAVAICQALGVAHEAVARGLRDVRVPGRMELYSSADRSVVGVVDYAHNGMSMEALLGAVRAEFPGRELTVVFGSCGERGLDRRAGLGEAAGRLADRVILTEDEPGRVDPALICEEIGSSVREAGGDYRVVLPREEAVREAVRSARRPAAVVLAGKGSESTMLRAQGEEPYGPDARILCDELGIDRGSREETGSSSADA